MGNSSLSTISREEVVENGCIEGSDGALSEIIIIGFNLWAKIIMRILDQNLNHIGILFAEFTKSLILLVELIVLHGGEEAIILLLLISLPVLLHDDGPSEVLQEVSAEYSHRFRLMVPSEMMIDPLPLIVELFIFGEICH